MSEAGFDDLEFARQQLHLAVAELSGAEMTPQERVQLGLLAAQVALGDRLSALLPRDAAAETAPADHRLAADQLAVVDELALAAGKGVPVVIAEKQRICPFALVGATGKERANGS